MIYKKLKLYAPERIGFAYLGIVLAFVAAFFSVASYYYIFRFFEKVIVDMDMGAAVPIAFRIVLFLIISTAVYFMSVWATHALAFRLETNLKKEGVKRLMKASFGFYDRNESGRIRKILDDNTVMTHMSVAHLIPDLSTAVFVPVIGTALSFYIDHRLGILVAAALVTGVLFIVKMTGEKNFMAQYMAASEKMNAGAVEYVRGINVLKIFKTRMESLSEFYNSVISYSDLALRYSMSCRNWYVIFQVLFNGLFLAVLFFFYAGDPDPRVFLTKFMFYVIFNGVIYISMMKIMYVGMYSFQAGSAIGNIEKLFGEMEQQKLPSGELDEMNGNSVEFRDVSFGYGERTVIDKLSFRLEEGRSYALVGASGSGKSTIAKLISGFYKLNNGQIFIGGSSIEEYSEETLAANIANVFQDVKLFKQSIYDNVLIGDPCAGREAVMQALHLAQCDEILDKFESRENTVIGSKGVHLSGGELQRISIARAILKNAGIVILDEASGAADPENEYELQKALSNLMKEKTVIMIAHRLSSITEVDEILVIDKGKIIERGSHEQLMSGDSRYRTLQEEFMRANEWRVRQ